LCSLSKNIACSRMICLEVLNQVLNGSGESPF
jgi:hypothetical protein